MIKMHNKIKYFREKKKKPSQLLKYISDKQMYADHAYGSGKLPYKPDCMYIGSQNGYKVLW